MQVWALNEKDVIDDETNMCMVIESLGQWHREQEVWLQFEMVGESCFPVRIVDKCGVPVLMKVQELYSLVLHIIWKG